MRNGLDSSEYILIIFLQLMMWSCVCVRQGKDSMRICWVRELKLQEVR